MSEASPESGWDRRRRHLLSEYERIALELFAARGFRSVTVDEIAAAAGVTARTLYRYFPVKEDFLLHFPRQALDVMVDGILALPPSDTPLQTAWTYLRDLLLAEPPEVEVLNLWRRAAADVPEVVARVRGERVQALLDAVATYSADSLGPRADVDSRIVGGILAGVDLAAIEAWGRTDEDLVHVLDAAERAIRAFDHTPAS